MLTPHGAYAAVGAGPGQLLITNRLGKPVQRDSFSDLLGEAVKAMRSYRGGHQVPRL